MRQRCEIFRKFVRYCLGFTGADGAVLLLGRIILLANAFVISIFLLKKFGLAAVGTYAIANIAVVTLSMLCGLGLNYSLPRESLTNRQRNAIALVWSSLLAPISLTLIVAYAAVMGQNRLEVWEIALFASGGFFAGLSNVTNTLFLMEQRVGLSLIFPVVHTVGLLIGMIYSQTLLNFALVLIVFRALGSFIPFSLLRYSRVAIPKIWNYGIRGSIYLPPDVLAMLSEQAGQVILGLLLSRGDFGIFGLCRQVLTAGDYPGWSFAQSIYPRLVRARLETVQGFLRQNTRLSFLVAVAVLAGSFVLGFFIYLLPRFSYLMIPLAMVIPFRYSNCFYDQVIKSVGEIKLNIILNAIKLLVAIPLFFIMGKFLNVWGAVLGLAGISIFSYLIYRKTGSRFFPSPAEVSPGTWSLARVQSKEPLLNGEKMFAKVSKNLVR
jgi:O-antigen/teichoic acid export membrane protein